MLPTGGDQGRGMRGKGPVCEGTPEAARAEIEAFGRTIAGTGRDLIENFAKPVPAGTLD